MRIPETTEEKIKRLVSHIEDRIKRERMAEALAKTLAAVHSVMAARDDDDTPIDKR